MRALLIIAACAAAAGVAIAQDAAATLYAPFDGAPDAAMAAGDDAATVEGSPRFIDGRVGQAIVVNNENWLSYPLAGNMNPSQGAIEFWLKPIDWDGTDDTGSHFFVGAEGEDRVYVYKFARWRHFTFHVRTDDAETYESMQAGIYQWQAGDWHHAVVTWDPAYMRIYLDGEMKAEASIPSPINDLGDTIFVGKELATPQFAAGETAIDELRIYPRPLFPEEVARAYRRAEEPQTAQQQYEDLLIYYTGFPSQERADLQFVASVGVPEGGQARLSISDPASGRVAIERDLPVTDDGTIGDVEISTSDLTPAAYDVAVRITDADGNELLAQSKRLWIRDRYWQREPQGLTDEVPEPWTPVEVGGLTAKTWNRIYRLGRGQLQSLTTAGEQILSRPMGLHGAADGAAIRHGNDWTLVSETPQAAVFESELLLGQARIPQRLTVEYDGFMRLDATVPAGARLDTLRLEVPVRREIAQYRRNSSQRERYYVSGELAPGNWPAAEVYDFWLGNEDLGVNVIYEGCIGWPTEGDETQVELTADEDEAVFVTHIAREPVTLERPLELSFGIIGTPVRPLPERWREEWRLSPRIGENPEPEVAEEYGAGYAVIWWSERPDTPRWFAFPEPQDPVAFQQMVDAFHAAGVKVLIYGNLTNLSPNVPEAIEFSGEWFLRPTPALLPDPDDPAPPERWSHTRLQDRSWVDFIIGSQSRVIEQYGVDGWYFDCATPYGSAGLHPVFDYREACKRAYVALKQRKPDGAIITHMSAHYTAAFLSFSDAMLQGEQFRWPLEHWQVVNDYTQVLRLDYARTELTGRNLGVVPVFLPEFGGMGGGERNERNSEHLLAFTRLHDINVWPIWTRPQPFGAIWKAQDERFGIGEEDVQFVPYWQTQPAEVDAAEVLVSAYTREGRALLVVSNFLGHEDRRVSVRPNLQLLGLEGEVTAQDLLTGDPVALEAGAMSLDIAEGRARYVVIEER
ncbi:MAG: LamG domain-containing protein [candidate division WS1 bacterium]|nr:LamG domain-containing protein [candidate division WS1 bacterium]